MQMYNLENFIGGWFLGNFEPSIVKTEQYEVGVKEYKCGAYEKKHVHKIATEITVIVDGKVRMNGKEYSSGDIVLMEPGEATDFYALTDVKNVVIKYPSVIGDKYEVD